jgi:hypothetical protein
MRFWNMDTSPSCGRPYDYPNADQALYMGHSLQEGHRSGEAGEAALFDNGDTPACVGSDDGKDSDAATSFQSE